jgi:hypothetical protein
MVDALARIESVLDGLIYLGSRRGGLSVLDKPVVEINGRVRFELVLYDNGMDYQFDAVWIDDRKYTHLAYNDDDFKLWSYLVHSSGDGGARIPGGVFVRGCEVLAPAGGVAYVRLDAYNVLSGASAGGFIVNEKSFKLGFSL